MKKRSLASAPSTDGSAEVDTWLAKLDHPMKPVLQAIRKVVVGADPSIREGIKWNSPSFRVDEWFATAGTHRRDVVQLVFHLGAKVKDDSTKGVRIDDPGNLLEWHAKDRCSIKLASVKEVKAHERALRSIVKQWIGRRTTGRSSIP